MRYRFIPPQWLRDKSTDAFCHEGEYTVAEAGKFNAEGYGIFYFPNFSSRGGQKFLTAGDIDTFQWVFVDVDFKHGVYGDVAAVTEKLATFPLAPTKIISTGHGVHAYWRVSDLDAISFLRLGYRLCRLFDTDSAVVKLEQVMRAPETLNTKSNDEDWPLCISIRDDEKIVYTSEDLHRALPPIATEDEAKAQAQLSKASGKPSAKVKVPPLPQRFVALMRHNLELKRLFQSPDDRSVADFNIGRILFAYGFSKDELMGVLTRTFKASERAPHHQEAYAQNIIDKVWEEPEAATEGPRFTSCFSGDIVHDDSSQGVRIVCHPAIDATVDGFRRGQVLGLVGATGNGKSTFALNMVRWFAEYGANTNQIYLYVLLESTKEKLGRKWEKMTAQLRQERPDVNWNNVMCCLSNYNEDGSYRDLGVEDIQEHVKWLEASTKRKVGVIVIDHIGKLRQTKNAHSGEYDGLIGVCKQMNPLAVSTDTFVIVQSQTSRAKGDAGDVELDVDAAFGVSSFEWHVDHLLVVWQPLRRVYSKMPPEGKLCITLYKFCKARERNVLHDLVQLDVPYGLRYDPDTEIFRMMTSDEEKAYRYWAPKAQVCRERNKKRDPSELVSVTWVK